MHAAGGRGIGLTRALALVALGLTAGTAVRADEPRLARLLRLSPAGDLQARHQDQQPAAPRPRRRQGRRHRRRQQRPVADRPALERQEARRRRRGRAEGGAERGRQRPPDAAGERAGEQGGGQPPGRRLQRRRQGRPRVLRNPGRAGRHAQRGRAAKFREAKRINTGEAVESGTALAVGDLNRDGRDDLALLDRERARARLPGREGASSASPSGFPTPRATRGCSRAVDLDGDGGNDLVILDGGTDDPIRVRFSAEGGKLGPEQRFQVESPKAIAFGQIDGKPGAELLTDREPVGPRPGLDPRRGRQGRRARPAG